MGYDSTLSYVKAAAAAILHETGLLPHVNAGVMQLADVESLRLVSASQGLMLESTSAHLMLPGGAHFECPDKVAPRNAQFYLHAVTETVSSLQVSSSLIGVSRWCVR